MSETIIDPLDYKILRVYHRDPFQSYHAISKQVDVHHSTVGDRIASMKERGILQEDYIFKDWRIDSSGTFYKVSRKASEVVAEYSPARMGLTRINVLFKQIKSVNDFEILEKFIGDHPYTHYYSQLYGRGVSLYSQFDVPNGTIDLHLETFNSLMNEFDLIGSYDVFFDNYEASSHPDFDTQISFSENEFVREGNYFKQLWDSFIDDKQEKIELKVPEVAKPFDNLDAELIREIGINAKLNISSLTNYYDRNKSTLSRRLSKIQELYIDRGKLRFGPQSDKIHGFNNTQVVTGKFLPGSDVNTESLTKLVNAKGSLPFESMICVNNDEKSFLFMTHTNIGIAGDIMDFLFKETDPYYLNQYQFYISKSITFPFWYGNYDEDEGYKTSAEYIKDNELEKLDHIK